MKGSTKLLKKKANMAARERYEQAMIDADIEGLPRSPEIEAMIAEWDAAGIDAEEQIRRLKAHFAERSAGIDAAE